MGVCMAGRRYRGLRRSVAVVALLVCATALLTGSPAGGSAAPRSLRVVQLNLCDSGIAGCYTGRAVAQAAAVIRGSTPDVVTLNEICAADLTALARALGQSSPGATVVPAFQPALDRRSGAPFRCRNGQQYGIGLLVLVPGAEPGAATHGGTYPAQDTRDPEERVWLCVTTATVDACTTHLASTSPAVALRQCGYLLGTAIPALHAQNGYLPTVLGGDFNLRRGGTPDLRDCLPAGYPRADDGDVQHIVATPDLRLDSSRLLNMGTSTDHPGLLATLTIDRPASP